MIFGIARTPLKRAHVTSQLTSSHTVLSYYLLDCSWSEGKCRASARRGRSGRAHPI